MLLMTQSRTHQFLNSNSDFSLAQAKLSLETNCNTYSGGFDATVKYLTTQVTHQLVTSTLSVLVVRTKRLSKWRMTRVKIWRFLLYITLLTNGTSILLPRIPMYRSNIPPVVGQAVGGAVIVSANMQFLRLVLKNSRLLLPFSIRTSMLWQFSWGKVWLRWGCKAPCRWDDGCKCQESHTH